MLVQKKQVKPIKFKGLKPENRDAADEWEELDELAKSTIMLSLDKSVFYNVNEAKNITSYGRSYVAYSSKRVLLHKFTGLCSLLTLR